MKILHVLNSTDPENGGTVEAVRGMAESQATLGHEVTVVSTGDPRKAPTSSQNVHWQIRPVRSKLWRWSPALYECLYRLCGAVDIVHLHTLWDYPIRAGARAAYAFQKPYLISAHGMLDKWSLSQHALRKKLYLFLIAGGILKDAKAVHFTSSSEYHDSTLNNKNHKAFICHLGVDVLQAKESDVSLFYETYPELKEKPYILYLGRLHYQKRPDLIIESFKEVIRHSQNVFLVMAGPSEVSYLGKLKNRVRALGLDGRVIFTGLLSRSMATAVLQNAVLLVMPSFRESFGLSVAEAMAASCAVIVSPGVNLSNEIKASGAGIVCQPNTEAMSQAMLQILSDDVLRQQMGQNGHRLVMNQFQRSRATEIMVRIYEDILKKQHFSPAWIER